MRLIVAVVLALSLLGCADDSDSTGPTEPYAAGEALTEWVTTEEMAGVLEQVSTQFTGSALADEVVAESADEEFWYRSGVPAGEETEFFNGGWEVLLEPWSDERSMEGAQPDPALPEGVEAAGPQMGGSYFMRGPLSDEILSIWINPPESLGSSDAGEARWQDLYFQVASMALVEMGWAE
jgi:hypothetical protein